MSKQQYAKFLLIYWIVNSDFFQAEA